MYIGDLMGFFDELNKMHKKTDIWDTGLTKWASIFFAFMVAKLWPDVLLLDWYVYLIIALVFAIRPLYHFFGKLKK